MFLEEKQLNFLGVKKIFLFKIAMLTKNPQQLITYKKIAIYEQSYQLPIFQNRRLKIFQKTIKERRKLIQEGIRYYYYFGKIVKRKEKSTKH